MNESSRRNFVKNLMGGALAVTLSPLQKISDYSDKNRVKKGEMFYRRLGRTDLWISEISLGGSPVPDWAIFMQIIEKGVNYIDTSNSYMNGNSERQIGRVLKEVGRDRVHVGTKFHLRGNWSEESIIDSVDGSLRRLQTDYLDVLLIHGASDPDHLTDEKILGAFDTLKKQGKFRFRGLSCHTNHHEVVAKAVECGHYDMVQLGYNVFDIQDTEKEVEIYDDYLGASGTRRLISLAKSKDVGIIAMKTLKVGGRRQDLKEYRTGDTSIFQAMLKWALENQDISSVVTEILTFQQMEEDLAVPGQPLSKEERKILYRFVARNLTDYCHMCGICQKNCPYGILTSTILRYLAYSESYGKMTAANQAYTRLPRTAKVESCQDCGKCEESCPYGVSIRKRIKEAHALFG
jgi:predicted aldo/keto reductase-like oxidoreductase